MAFNLVYLLVTLVCLASATGTGTEPAGILYVQTRVLSAPWSVNYNWKLDVVPTPTGCPTIDRYAYFSHRADWNVSYNAVSGGGSLSLISQIFNMDGTRTATINGLSFALSTGHFSSVTSNCSTPFTLAPTCSRICAITAHVSFTECDSLPYSDFLVSVNAASPFNCANSTTTVQWQYAYSCGELYDNNEIVSSYVCVPETQTISGSITGYKTYSVDVPCGQTTENHLWQFFLDDIVHLTDSANFCVKKTCAGTSSNCRWQVCVFLAHPELWPSGYSKDALFLSTGITWYRMLGLHNNCYQKLAQQYIACSLNIALGAALTPDYVVDAFQRAGVFLADHSSDCSSCGSQVYYDTRILELYNSMRLSCDVGLSCPNLPPVADSTTKYC